MSRFENYEDLSGSEVCQTKLVNSIVACGVLCRLSVKPGMFTQNESEQKLDGQKKAEQKLLRTHRLEQKFDGQKQAEQKLLRAQHIFGHDKPTQIVQQTHVGHITERI